MLDVAVIAPMTKTELTGPYSMVSGSSSASMGPHPRGRPRPVHRLHRKKGFAPPGPSGTADGRVGGRILVTVVPTSLLPVVAEMSRLQLPSSPAARSCGCLHRGSSTQAVSKTGEAAHSHVPMASASGITPRRARSLRSRAGVGADIARARGLVRVRLQHAHRQG